MQKWEHMKLAIVAVNNHYAGTVNIFSNMIVLPEARWEDKEMGIQNQEDQYISWIETTYAF